MTRLLTGCLVACALASATEAAPMLVKATQAQESGIESKFEFVFPVGDGTFLRSEALISNTDMELEVDGIGGTAKFVRYDQDIHPLYLPGGLSTGAIRVEVTSSTGVYDRATGDFVTDDEYLIHFEGDLSDMGLFSPIPLPSQSVGTIDIGTGIVGRISMNWAGSSVDNPTIPFDFSYLCTLFASFSPTASSFVEFELVPMVSATPMSPSLRETLMTYVNSALASFSVPNVRSGVASLQTFIFKVRTSLGRADGSPLMGAAEMAIMLAENRYYEPMQSTPDGQLFDMMVLPGGGTAKGTSRIIR